MSSEEKAILETGRILRTIIQEAGSIIEQLLEASMASPIVAAASMAIIADILEKQVKIISSDTAALVKGMAVTLTASNVISSFISGGIKNLTLVKGKKSDATLAGALNAKEKDDS